MYLPPVYAYAFFLTYLIPAALSNYSATIVYLTVRFASGRLCRSLKSKPDYSFPFLRAFMTGYYFIRSRSPSTGTHLVAVSKTLSIIPTVLWVGQFQQPQRNFMNYLPLTFSIIWYSAHPPLFTTGFNGLMDRSRKIIGRTIDRWNRHRHE